jgi:hypothetical protein
MNRLPTLLLASALLACGGDDDEGLPDANEPNNTFATATPLTIGTPVVAAISPTSDVDYYVFAVPAGGASVRFQTFDSGGVACDPTHGNVDPVVGVFGDPPDVNNPIIVSDDSGLPPWCEDVTVALAEGTNYVGVAGYPPEFRYTLSVTIVP